MTQGVGNWTFNVLPDQAGRRSEKQSPWYDMATAAVAMIARPYIPQGGKVYDLGCAAGNVGRVLAPTLHEREAQFVALDGCRDVVVAYCGPGRAIMADVAKLSVQAFRRGGGLPDAHGPALLDAATFIVDIAEQDEAGRGNHHHK